METRTTCCYCGVGCGVIVEHDDARITGVRGDPDHPANRGRLCSKGQALALTSTPAAMRFRAKQPLRRDVRGGVLEAIDWNEAQEELADRFAACVRTHGPDSVAFYISGQLTIEDYYVFNKLAKGLIGTNNVDTNSRLCMSSAVTAYKQTLGADAPPTCYDDIDDADLIFIAGSNAAWAHPVLFRRIEAAKTRNPGLRIVVVDPRRTSTAAASDLHLAIAPGTDVALFHGMLHVLFWEERVDAAFIAAHTEGVAALKAIVRDFTPRFAADVCGVAEEDVIRAARWFGEASAVLSLYCQGLNQSTSGTAKNAALLNLHLATGQIGRRGAGPFSLTGQPNAMGGREVGGMATLASAHRDLDNPTHRAEIAKLWGVESVPATPGKTAIEMFDAVARGEIRMLWIACTNPAQSMPDQAAVRRGLARAELVVLQEAYSDTETAAFADFVLPASSFAEKDGTMTNSERRISRVRAAVPPPGESRSDWRIVVDFARRLERRIAPGRTQTLFPYASASDIFDEHVATTLGRDLDITGLSYAVLDAQGPQQWPYPEGANEGRSRLYVDHRFATPNGKARFAAVAYSPPAEAASAHYPLRLTTGRLRDQWHGMSRTGTTPALYAHAPEPALEISATDANRRGLKPGDLAHIASRRGAMVVSIALSDELQPGVVFLPMHWGSATLCSGGGVNTLTTNACCADSKQPELKHAAVRVTRAELPHRLVAFGVSEEDDSIALRARLRDCLSHLPFASVVLLAGEHSGLLVRAASDTPIPRDVVDVVDAGFKLDDDRTARYEDARRGIERRIRLRAGLIRAVRLSGDASAEPWLRDFMVGGRDVTALRARLLTASSSAPCEYRSRGRVVCTCFDVGEEAIEAALRAMEPDDVDPITRVQAKLKCGTQCGSCLPELRRLVQTSTVPPAVPA